VQKSRPTDDNFAGNSARAQPRLNLVLFYGPLQRTTDGSGNDRRARTKHSGNLYLFITRVIIHTHIYIRSFQNLKKVGIYC